MQPNKNPADQLMPESPIKVEAVQYSADELSTRGDYIRRLQLMWFEREMKHPELDGMTYLEWYDSNRKKDLSYIPPKKTKDDIRIVTGTTREKDTSLLATLLNMNVEPQIHAFDEDNMVVSELGTNVADLVKKSRHIEDWDKKRSNIYREMIAQGDVFVEEIFREEFQDIPIDQLDWDPTKNTISELSFKTRLQKVYSGCEVRMVNGKKVLLGSVRIEHIEDQDIVAIINIYSRAKCKSIYGEWERYKNVPYNINGTNEIFISDGKTYRDWNLIIVPWDRVVETKIFDKGRNRFQIMLNGVMMLPWNYPLTAVSPTGEIPMSQGKLEPISDYAYSKSQPSKIKIDQEVLDEATKLMIEKFRYSFKPPMGNSSKKIYNQSIFAAGKITSDIKEGELFPLVPGQGIGQADFSFYEMIKNGIGDKSMNDVSSGQNQTPGSDPTLGQLQLEQQAQMLKLGLALDGVINLEKRMTWNRIYNMFHNWLQMVEPGLDKLKQGIKQAYEDTSVETSLENGESGVKVFKFANKKDFPEDVHDQHKEEQKLTKLHGKPVRVIYMDPEMLRSIKYRWYITIEPTPKSNAQLAQMVFIKVVTEAQQIFGPQALNMDYLKQRFAVVMKENYEKFFVKASVQQAMQMQNPQVQANALGAPAPSNQPNNPPQPTGNPMRQPIRPIQATQTIQ